MRFMMTRWRLALVGLACLLVSAWLLGAWPGLPRARARRVPVLPAPECVGPTRVYFGSAACGNKGCHGGEPPAVWTNDKELLVRGCESHIWAKYDRHADAYLALTGPRGRQMARILGYDVRHARACLVCHAAWIDDRAVLAASKDNHFRLEEGVSCVVCHGPAEEWVALHGVMVTARTFRPLPPAVKEARYGMRDLRDPLKRAELCVSCHVGNLAEGKFVTHEMYAAGHPPLPAFEAATFTEQMPRHHLYLAEKSPAIQRERGLRPGERERTQLLLVGAVVSFRDTMRLLAGQARAARTAPRPDDRALDLANFDCYACHHGLRSKSWRQERIARGRGVPGRVPMRAWSTELVRLAVVHLGLADRTVDGKALMIQLDEGLKKLNAAFDARAFGSPLLIEKAAGDLAAWADALARRSKALPADSRTAAALLARLPGLADGERLLDYDSARQVSWAFTLIYGELAGPRPDPRLLGQLGQVDRLVKFRLPAGRGTPVEPELSDSLERIKKYDARDFRTLFGPLGKMLEPGK